jgi:hypothetical protein
MGDECWVMLSTLAAGVVAGHEAATASGTGSDPIPAPMGQPR